jgi:queuosine precursor transporter
MPNRRDSLYLFLALIVLSTALIAEVIGPKIFSFNKVVDGAVGEGGWFKGIIGIDLNLSAGVLQWPIVFVTTDLINHYFGRRGVLRISWLTFGFLILMFLALYATAALPPADFWVAANSTDGQGRYLDLNYAIGKLFRQGAGIVIGSLIAFLVGQAVDATVYQWLRSRIKKGSIGLLATVSTIFSQLLDSFLILYIAFSLLGNWTGDQVISVGTTQFLYKVAVAIALVPLLYVAHAAIDRYLGLAASVPAVTADDSVSSPPQV